MTLTDALETLKTRLESTGVPVRIADVERFLASANMFEQCLVIDYSDIRLEKDTDGAWLPTTEYTITIDVLAESMRGDPATVALDLAESTITQLNGFELRGQPVLVTSIEKPQTPTISTAQYRITVMFTISEEFA